MDNDMPDSSHDEFEPFERYTESAAKSLVLPVRRDLAISFLEHLPPHRLHVIDSMRWQKQCMWDQWVMIYSQELSYLG